MAVKGVFGRADVHEGSLGKVTCALCLAVKWYSMLARRFAFMLNFGQLQNSERVNRRL